MRYRGWCGVWHRRSGLSKRLDSSALPGEHKISNYRSLIPSHTASVKYSLDVVYLLNCVHIQHILGLSFCCSIRMTSVSQQILQSENSDICSCDSVEPRSHWISCIGEEKKEYGRRSESHHRTWIRTRDRTYVPEEVWLLTHDDKRRTKHATYAEWDGQGARTHHCRSSCASFNVSQPGHQKPWRAKTRYQCYPMGARALAFRLSVSSLSLTHSVSMCIIRG